MAIGILVPGHVAESRGIDCADEMVKEEQMAAQGWVGSIAGRVRSGPKAFTGFIGRGA